MLRLLIFAALVASPFIAYRIGARNWQVEPEVTSVYYPSQVETLLVRVTDGATIVVSIAGKQQRVQLLGIDAGEIFRKVSVIEGDSLKAEWEEIDDPVAREALQRLEKLLAGQALTLEFEERQRDRYGRLLAYVWLKAETGEPLLANEWMLREGLVEPYRYGQRLRYAERLDAAVQGKKSE